MLNASARAQLKADFAGVVTSHPTYYRAGRLVSEETAIKVLEACLLEQDGIDVDAPPKSQWAFRQRVKKRLRSGNDVDGVPFGIDPLTILLIFKLILLFIELWFKFTNAEKRGPT